MNLTGLRRIVPVGEPSGENFAELLQARKLLRVGVVIIRRQRPLPRPRAEVIRKQLVELLHHVPECALDRFGAGIVCD